MAAPVWNTHATRPFGIGGVAMFCAWVLPGSEDPADAILGVAALVAPSPVSWGDDAILVDLPLEENAMAFMRGLPAGPVAVCWFAQTASGWIAGPVDSVDLADSWTAQFNYPKAWGVDILQQLERDTAPLGSDVRLEIRTSFPRDTIPLPCLSVQFESSPQATRLLANLARDLGATSVECRIPWNVTLTTQLWCETPEDRDHLAPWYLNCMSALAELAPHEGMEEPTFQFQENEDFSMAFYEHPIFLVTGTLSGTVWSTLVLPVRNWIGFITV